MKAVRFTVKTVACLGLLVLCACWWSYPVSAEVRIAKVNLAKAYKGSKKVVAMVQDMAKLNIDLQARLQKLASEVQAMTNKLKDRKDDLKKEEKEKLQLQLRAKKEALINEKKALKVKMGFKRKSLQNSITQLAVRVVADIAKREGFQAVIPERVLLFSEGLPDITDKVIKAFDESGEGADKK